MMSEKNLDSMINYLEIYIIVTLITITLLNPYFDLHFKRREDPAINLNSK